jgi:hypothetical protein
MNEKEFEELIRKKPIVFDETTRIFTTGAFLSPLKVTDGEGKIFWVWRVVEFVEDSFQDGELFNPVETAQSRTDLLKADE